MIFGLINLITVVLGFGITFYSEDDDQFLFDSSSIPDDLRHWPTDTTADIHPIACHSHNDYWRKEPLLSALSVGCESVEADVWLHDGDLFVGHNAASLTTHRTLRSLYLDPILSMLDKQNPIHALHPELDEPRNGIFDTKPEQSLILLIDFKTHADDTFSAVADQLEPLRQKRYLTHFNGTDVVQAPLTVVLTGNAPWNRVVESSRYRDMFFDAPLDLMADLDATSPTISDSTDLSSLVTNSSGTPGSELYKSTASTSPTDQGQGRSGAAPLNPAAYSPANSYFASVSFKKALFHKLPLPWQFPFRSTLTDEQLEKIRAQIRGAHQRGLKVRYWGVPDWPRGLREYLWRVMITEGADYLNVDDLWEAKKGGWFDRWEDGPGNWWGRGRRGGRGRGGGRESGSRQHRGPPRHGPPGHGPPSHWKHEADRYRRGGPRARGWLQWARSGA
jgi:hypothetical protein